MGDQTLEQEPGLWPLGREAGPWAMQKTGIQYTEQCFGRPELFLGYATATLTRQTAPSTYALTMWGGGRKDSSCSSNKRLEFFYLLLISLVLALGSTRHLLPVPHSWILTWMLLFPKQLGNIDTEPTVLLRWLGFWF